MTGQSGARSWATRNTAHEAEADRRPSRGDSPRLRLLPGGLAAGAEVSPRTEQGEASRTEAATGAEQGMATAEYAIATLAAVAFAGLLVVILRSDEVRGFLVNIIRAALSVP